MTLPDYSCLCLGTGNAVINSRENGPGFLVRWRDKLLLFDIGYGCMREMLRHQFSYKELDAIFLSHWHIDHISDLLPSLFIANIPTFHRKKPLPVFTPPGFQKIFDQLTNIFGKWINSTFSIDIIECHPEVSMQWKGINISCFPMAHSTPALGYRLHDSEKVFSYSGDTQQTPVLRSLLKDSDLSIIECSFPSNMSLPGHMNIDDIIALVREDIPYNKLALYHLYSPARIENIRKELSDFASGKVLIPQKGDIILF